MKKKLIIVLITISIITLFFYKHNTSSINSNIYSIIKQDINTKYPGIGQEKKEKKDGYLTTFTTIPENKKTYIEYKQNGSSSWSNKDYFGGKMKDTGCGITALAIILSGYQKNYTPEELRTKYYPVLKGEEIANELTNTFNISNTGFFFDDYHLSDEYIINHLKTNRPVLLCLWNKPNDNRWTKESHYMVLLAADDYDMVYVSNPNGLENDSKSSGWYNISEITPYLAKALYIETY